METLFRNMAREGHIIAILRRWHLIVGSPTYRDLARGGIVDAIAESIGGSAWSIRKRADGAWSIDESPWSDEFEDALKEFLAKFNALIDAAPAVAEVLDQPLSPAMSAP